MDEINYEDISLSIIATSGGAKSAFLEAVELAKQGKIEEAKAKIKEGQSIFSEGHADHFKLITAEANGTNNERLPLLLIHAEDQMASAESIEQLAISIVNLYEVLVKNNLKL